MEYLRRSLPAATVEQASYRVAADMVTHHVPNSPAVLMTPTLIALLEETAARIVRPYLADDSAAVGTFVCIHHTGAARLDEQVDIRAEVVAQQGRRVEFEVSATVDGRPVGHGQIGFTLIHRPAS